MTHADATMTDTLLPSPRAWIRMHSGRHLDLLNPSPDNWTDEDLAMRMARTPRWGGDSAWPLPLSVAQHVLTVLALRRAWAPSGLPPYVEALELHHDDDEGLLAYDCVSTLKVQLGEPFARLSTRLQGAVFARYRLPPWPPAEYVIHKRADHLAAATEAVRVAGWSEIEAREVLGIQIAPLESDPLVPIYGCEPWEPWPPYIAAERYLNELRAIQKRVDADLAR